MWLAIPNHFAETLLFGLRDFGFWRLLVGFLYQFKQNLHFSTLVQKWLWITRAISQSCFWRLLHWGLNPFGGIAAWMRPEKEWVCHCWTKSIQLMAFCSMILSHFALSLHKLVGFCVEFYDNWNRTYATFLYPCSKVTLDNPNVSFGDFSVEDWTHLGTLQCGSWQRKSGRVAVACCTHWTMRCGKMGRKKRRIKWVQPRKSPEWSLSQVEKYHQRLVKLGVVH